MKQETKDLNAPKSAKELPQKNAGTSVNTSAKAPAKAPVKENVESLFGSALVANFFAPGFGSWRMGEKTRGGVIFAMMLGCVLMAGLGYVSGIAQQMDAALDIQDDAAFDASFKSSGSLLWVVLALIVFAWSFVDVFLIYRRKKREAAKK